MRLNDTPSSERVHIGFFGKRNAGKSSVVNAFTNQELSVVSDVKGTTTDPVYKAMELLPMGPVVIIDTAGIDDEGELGALRVKKTKQALNRCDCAILVTDGTEPMSKFDNELIEQFTQKNIPYIIARNKCDLDGFLPIDAPNSINVSALTGENINELREMAARLLKTDSDNRRIVGDLIKPNDFVVLVIPIDSSAPKGRIILPQQQTLRDILDEGAVPIAVRDTELAETLESLGKKPSMVITDSQVFKKVAQIVPEDIPLTSFSILMARYKGFLDTAVKGAYALDSLCDGDKILISEGCTHHRQCEDIGTVKLPNWIKKHTQKELVFEFSSGREFPESLTDYKLVIHCGGCMLGSKEVMYRMKCANDQGVPFTNYGTAIAHMQGILKRTVEIP